MTAKVACCGQTAKRWKEKATSDNTYIHWKSHAKWSQIDTLPESCETKEDLTAGIKPIHHFQAFDSLSLLLQQCWKSSWLGLILRACFHQLTAVGTDMQSLPSYSLPFQTILVYSIARFKAP